MEAKNTQTTSSQVASVVTIPGYVIKDVLGRGGMATVYLAVQESIGRQVALKVLFPDHSDPSFSDRFLREAQIISKLAHPNIVTIYDAGIHQGCHYMAMEFITGKNLREARDDLSRKEKVKIIKQIAQALDFAGSKGYVHRDIKPENIMLNEDGRAILTDFGIARGQDTKHGLTQTGKTIGTPYYMSPEQTKGTNVDHRSDIYSMGVVLFQALAGYVPYDGASLVEIGIKHISEPIPELPKGLELFQPIINKCMSKDPAHRYQTAGEFLAALNTISDAELDYIEAKARVTAPPRAPHTGTVLEDAVTPPPVSRPASPAQPRVRNTLRPPPMEAARSDEFRTLKQRRRMLVLLILVVITVLGYVQRDRLLPVWQTKIQPVIEPYLPDGVKQQLGMDPAAQPSSPTNPADQSAQQSEPVGPAVSEQPVSAQAENSTPGNDADQQVMDPVVTLQQKLAEQPEHALELAHQYRERLKVDPEDVAAQTGIKNLHNWYRQALQSAMADRDTEQARKLISMLTDSYPRVAQTPRYQQAVLHIERMEQYNKHVRMANVYFATNALAKPEGANALEELLAASRLEPGTEEVKQGLEKIADAHYTRAQASKNIAEAMEYIETGLQAVNDHADLLQMKKELTHRVQNQKQTDQLVRQLQDRIKKRQYISPKGDSVYDLSRVILGRDPENAEALRGLRIVEEQFIAQANSALSNDKPLDAKKIIKSAQSYSAIAKSPALLRLQKKIDDIIDASFPKITQILFSDKPVSSLSDRPLLDKMRPGQLLYVGIGFKNFYTSSTTLNIRLTDSDGQELFSEIPVTVTGKSGSHYFNIHLPNSGAPNGDYALEILMENTRLIRAKLAGLH